VNDLDKKLLDHIKNFRTGTNAEDFTATLRQIIQEEIASAKKPKKKADSAPKCKTVIGLYTPDEKSRANAIKYWESRGRPDLVPDIEHHVSDFRAHHRAHGSRMEDWPSAWETWYSNAIRFTKPPAANAPPPHGAIEQTNDAGWENRLRVWYGTAGPDSPPGRWIPKWGPKPGEMGCLAPARLVERLRPRQQ
jgi:hypothetical protein